MFDEAIRNGRMLGLKDFDGLEHSIYRRGWLPTPWTVMQWALRQAGILSRISYDEAGKLRSGQLVLIHALEEVAEQVMAMQEKRGDAVTDRVMTRDSFAAQVAQTQTGSLSKMEIEILLKFLSRDKQLVSYNSRIVKFKAASASNLERINEEDATIASMKALISSLESQISLLTTRISNLQKTASSAVQSKNKTAALSALRSKKLAERSLQSRIDMLHKLEEVYAKIEQAVDQVQIMQVMQASAETLRNLNQRVGGAEKVDSVMENLRDQMGQVDEVGQILQEPLGEAAWVDETEIDGELEVLEKEEAQRKEEMRAEATKAQLAELESSEASIKTRARGKEEQASTEETELEKDMQKLERMHLEDGAAAPETHKGDAVLEAT